MNLQDMVSRFIEVGKSFIENYSLSGEEKAKVETLMDYFFECGCEKPISKNKGILLVGSIGVGKTVTMKIIQRMQPSGEKLRFTSCQYVVDAYDNEGEVGTDDYKTTRVFLFDDLGEENRGKHFGKDVEVMEKVIMARYNLYQSSGIKTYFTTNNSPQQLQDRYGERAFDRLKEMCNFIVWPGNESKRTKGILATRVKEPTCLITEQQITEQQKWQSSASHILSTFESYKTSGKFNDYGNVGYLFLERIGLIKYTPEKKIEIYNSAKAKLVKEQQIAALSATSTSIARTAKQILDNLNSTHRHPDIVNEARRQALKVYFDNLIEMDEDLEQLLNENSFCTVKHIEKKQDNA